jgi:IS5 family transposase
VFDSYIYHMKRYKNTGKMINFSSPFMNRNTRSSIFYNQMNLLVDWNKIEKTIERYYKKGNTLKGEKPYSGLLLFKMLLIGIWNNLSDPKTEDYLNDSISAMHFCGLDLEDSVPDHSTLSRFRTVLTETGAMDNLLFAINHQLESKKLIVKRGVKVDASLTETNLKPKGKTTYQIAEDRKEEEVSDEQKKKQTRQLKKLSSKGTDTEARWLKKGNRTIFGYKRHDGVDENGMILGVHTTTANEHDSKGLKPLLKKIPKRHKQKGVSADKGYKVPDNDKLLKSQGIKNRIQHKAYRNRPLTKWQKRFNKMIGTSRYVVERTYGGMKGWFGAGNAKYRGIKKMHTQHILEAICYNLKRSPGLVCQIAK